MRNSAIKSKMFSLQPQVSYIGWKTGICFVREKQRRDAVQPCIRQGHLYEHRPHREKALIPFSSRLNIFFHSDSRV